MLCQNCQKETATFHFRENFNGEKQQWHLCAACAKTHQDFFTERRMHVMQAMHHVFPLETDVSPVMVMERKKSTRPASSTISKQPNNTPKPMEELSVSSLQKMMQDCIQMENYEKAAQIRDEIAKRKR